MAKYINLTQNKFALIDEEDFKKVNKLKWHFDGRYAARKPKMGKVYLHKFIMGNDQVNGEIDHINQKQNIFLN